MGSPSAIQNDGFCPAPKPTAAPWPISSAETYMTMP